jgi:hypothetical protein
VVILRPDATLGYAHRWTISGVSLGERIRLASRDTLEEITQRLEELRAAGDYRDLEVHPPTNGGHR